MNQEVKQQWSKKRIYLSAIAIVAIVALCALAIIYRNKLINIAYVSGYSLLALFIISFIAGGPLSATAIPVPYWLLVITLPGVLAPRYGILAPVIVALVSALGDTVGDIPTFIIGWGGSGLARRINGKFNNPFFNRAMAWAKKHGSWASFTISALFNPVHLPMAIALGALRFSPLKFFFFDFLGAAVKCLFLAFCGYFGLTFILHLFGA